MPRIIVSIGGGHLTDIHKAILQIKDALLEAFVNTEVVLVDLDKSLKKGPLTHTDQDYDFKQVSARLCSAQDPNVWEAVLVCGAYALFDPTINELCHLKVFLDSDGDRRLIDLINRRSAKTPELLAALIKDYMENLRPEMHKYIEPTKAHADLIIPNSSENVGPAIIVDSIVKIVEDSKGGIVRPRKLFPHLDFQAESLDIEKEKYYDLS
ncbi:PRK domain-containing protein [Lachancea thermotolerans]|uniref:KLTH0C07986p n=1 Tax=Lachancea thermotolerans (strain ATCC 56472 / CBS 6340 / NRRL Y-8284) TaxID=559295 RepID=C5DEC1_LACTC|nr:KLTH0C07986p [Lachancea thermotolerans CBS 6340]CAR22132.1 KLTH0C07986p [Lachancea thermotolerans CBS 6340]